MSNLTRQKTLILIAAGFFLIALGLIINRLATDPDSLDFVMGAVEGLGIGLLLTALLKGKFRKTASQ